MASAVRNLILKVLQREVVSSAILGMTGKFCCLSKGNSGSASGCHRGGQGPETSSSQLERASPLWPTSKCSPSGQPHGPVL